MLKQRPLSGSFVFIWILLLITAFRLSAQDQDHFPPLEFSNNERIVFLGGSFFENELDRCYLELAIASRWPDRQLTFRNLGWTGDNVFGAARSTFTSPPTPYQQLFQQIRSTRPDYVLVAYGTVEAQKGEAGLEEFTRGLEAIIDSIDALGAQSILLSTIPVKMAGTPENTVKQNKYLKIYSDAIAGIAAKRKKRFVDLFTPVSRQQAAIYAYNGIHLNDAGYYFLAGELEKAFGWSARGETVTIDAATASRRGGKLTFDADEKLLPLPVPVGVGVPVVPGATSGQTTPGQRVPGLAALGTAVQISGLESGRYTLSENGKALVTATAEEWMNGIVLENGLSQAQAAQLSDSIARKNELFFHQYRPLNRTYILGFREYEQGRHKQGLKDLDPLIERLEQYISQHLKPVRRTYELSPAN